ncbi:MAG: cation transporter [Gammaproteobacteria bacterium]|nr:cation transporter [Gammaproteobacteria bacterium]
MSNQIERSILDRSNPERLRASKRVTVVSMVWNLVLTGAQTVIGTLGHSQALVADGLHTLSDLITDILVLFAVIHGHKAADADHPYGHARVETAVSLILGIALFGVGVGIAIRGGMRLSSHDVFIIPSAATLVTAVLTLVVKEVLYHYTMRTARRYDSNMLRGNAWHHRSDAISSLIVAAGIGGSMLGFGHFDAFAAILVAIMVMKVGVSLGWAALRELVDTGLSVQQTYAIEHAITAVPEVKALHVLRTRSMGGKALVDVHIQVSSTISVSEGHHISEVVRQQVINQVDEVDDVMVHVDPEDDERTAPSIHLPLRHVLVPQLCQAWASIPAGAALGDEDITLHYANGKLQVDLVLPRQLLENQPRVNAEQLAEQFAEAARSVVTLARVVVYFH